MSKLKLSVIEQKVYDLICQNPEAANDDSILLDLYWHKYDNWDDNKSLYWNLSRSTNPETITKRRRDLHRWEYIKYSNEADKRREEAYLNEKEHAGVKPVLKAQSWLDD